MSISTETYSCDHTHPITVHYEGDAVRDREGGTHGESETVKVITELCQNCFQTMYNSMRRTKKPNDNHGVNLQDKKITSKLEQKTIRESSLVVRDPIFFGPLFKNISSLLPHVKK